MHTRRMMNDTWTDHDLPALKAAVELWTERGRRPRATDIERVTGFDQDTVQRALRNLYTEPYFDGGDRAYAGHIIRTGTPTSAALRMVGRWPTPERLFDRLVAALEEAAQDQGRPEEERSRLKKAASALGGVVTQVAISALGGAGGNLLTGD